LTSQVDRYPASLAPVALLVYNRPEHTKLTIDALRANDLAEQTDLFVFSDAAKNERSVAGVEDVRKMIRSLTGFRSVTVVERPENLGLAKSVTDAVSELCSTRGSVIVVEDDLITSRHFLRYMNESLVVYACHPRVMHISAYMFPIRTDDLPQTFFYRHASCWGWATWNRSWQYFRKDIEWLDRHFDEAARERFNLNGAHDFWSQVEGNRRGTLDTWAIFWDASVFLNEGLCLHPAQSMVVNIGHDGSGTHCASTEVFDTTLATAPVTEWQMSFHEDPEVLRRMVAFYSRRTGLASRARSWLSRHLGQLRAHA
jgi:GT2 family glycosyltransferase